MPKVRLQDMTWREVDGKLRDGVTAVIPFGSQEQHGPQARPERLHALMMRAVDLRFGSAGPNTCE